MAEILVSTILFQGVSYLITAVNVMNTIRFYSEIQNKVSYIWIRKPPNKKQVMATLTILNQSTEATGNLYMAYDSVNNNSKKEKTYNKKQTHKLKSHHKGITMGKKGRIANSILDFMNYICVYREQSREASRERNKKRLFDYNKRKEARDDKLDQVEMNRLGFVRCERFCKFYTHPTRMLESICECATRKATLSKKYTPEQITELQTLIMNKGNRKEHDECDFDEFKHVFLYLELRCLECGNVHGESEEGERVYDVSTICRLQRAQIDIIFEKDMHIVAYKHEHDTCK
jgi:hypothetical protein